MPGRPRHLSFYYFFFLLAMNPIFRLTAVTRWRATGPSADAEAPNGGRDADLAASPRRAGARVTSPHAPAASAAPRLSASSREWVLPRHGGSRGKGVKARTSASTTRRAADHLPARGLVVARPGLALLQPCGRRPGLVHDTPPGAPVRCPGGGW